MNDADLKAFIVIGDTQRTSFLERLILRREANDAEREILFDHLTEQNPEFLVVVGDLVSAGSTSEWNYFFKLINRLQRRKIPIYPAKGNHDSNIEKYFEHLNIQGWYSKTVGSLGLIWLDTTSRCENQKIWFEEQLLIMDADPKIQRILVFAHHPPFTKSRIVYPSRYVQKTFVPAFQNSLKTCAFISGHHHGFERFSEGGKDFIVTGGGGGPRHKLNPYPFHYLRISSSDSALKFEIFGLQKAERQVRLLSEFKLQPLLC